MTKINRYSDFDSILRLLDSGGEPLPFPNHDFRAVFYCASGLARYEASCIGGVTKNCFNDQGAIHVVFNDHRLPCGQLMMELTQEHPDALYPDGSRRVVQTYALDIMLTNEASDVTEAPDIALVTSAGARGDTFRFEDLTEEQKAELKGEKGDTFRFEDLTEEQKAELKRPATDAALQVSGIVLELAEINHDARINESLRATAEEARAFAEGIRSSNENIRQQTLSDINNQISAFAQAEDGRENAEAIRVQAEQSRTAEETRRVTESNTLMAQLREAIANGGGSDSGDKKELFIDLWKAVGYDFNYNTATGFFEGNELKDITYEQAVAIYMAGANNGGDIRSGYNGKNIRTTLPVRLPYGANLHTTFNGSAVESVRLVNISNSIDSLLQTFTGCRKLHTILGIVYVPNVCGNTFENALILKNAQIITSYDVNFKWQPLLSLNSFAYIIANRRGTNTITITVHADVYAKITGDETNTAYSSLSEEDKAKWTALLAQATSKNITFAK